MARRVVRPKTVPEPPPEPQELDEAYLARLAEEFKSTKATIAEFEKRRDKMKAELTKAVIEHGEPDENGSLWLEVGGVKLKREKRVSSSFDREAAEQWAKENGYWEDVSELIPEHRELDEDKVVRLAWENDDVKLTRIIQGFYVHRETWAFKTP